MTPREHPQAALAYLTSLLWCAADEEGLTSDYEGTAKLALDNLAPLLTADLQAQLADPVAVHANMLRGTIAKPSIYQIMHIYGRDALMRAMDAEKMAALRKEFPNV